jgi:BirA family transcriptional regulator, biotin operon repressor / biotin---[acetyl-CoA-carboxylase] ligase
LIGRKIIYKDSLLSTNNYVANKVSQGEMEHGSVILAGNQSAGKGQREAKWDSEAYKNISLSIFLEYANLSLNNLAKINLFVSLACSDFLKEYHQDFKIKWPNDLVFGNQKIAGILIESRLEKSNVKSSIIGIGINVNQEIFGNYNATSLKIICEKEFHIQDLAFQLIDKLNFRFEQFNNYKFSELKSDYLKNLWLFQTKSNFKNTQTEEIFDGIITDIDENGNLVVLNLINNEQNTYKNKEIEFLERKN